MSVAAAPSSRRDRLNPFWAAVCGRQVSPDRPAIVADDLHEAALEAFRRPATLYGFRRPKELIDLDGRFRRFTFRGTSYVGKRCSRPDATREASHARRAASALAATSWLEPLVPTVVRGDEPDTCILLTQELGDSFAGLPLATSRAALPWNDVLAAIRRLLESGVEWVGFLPRNVLPGADGRLVLIDWEDCRFHRPGRGTRTIGDLTLLFWTIGWAHRHGLDAEQFRHRLVEALDLAVIEDPLDRFELAYASMLPPGVTRAEIRRHCSEATIATEATDLSLPSWPGAERTPPPLSPAEIGHLLDELLPRHLSVVYTFACKALLDQRDVARYLHVVEVVNRALVLGTPCEGAGTPAVRRRLRLLVFLAVVAVVFDGVPPGVGRSALDVPELVEELCRHGSLAGRLCPDRAPLCTGPSRTGTVDDESIERLLSLAADRLGVPGMRFHLRRTPDRAAVYHSSGMPASYGVHALSREVLELVGTDTGRRDRKTVEAAREP